MVDGTDGQVAFEFLEGLFDFGELEVMFPKFDGVGFREIGAQEVAPLRGLAALTGLEAAILLHRH